MSQRQETDEEEIAEKIAKDTVPGTNNRDVVVELAESAQAVYAAVLEDLNNWVEIVEVKYHGDRIIGIPCRYRWTIKRWVSNDMDEWLLSNGWSHMPHLKADSEKHRPNELEARYVKQFGDYDVYVNIWVPFTDDVFEAINEGEDLTEFKSADEKFEERMDILKNKRE